MLRDLGCSMGTWLELSQQGLLMEVRLQSCVKDLLFLKGCFMALFLAEGL